jgi:hypothetical protein
MNEKIRKRWEEEGRKREVHKNQLAEEHGVIGNPKLDKCYSLAWDHGHAYGLDEVASHFADFVELIK